MPYEDDSTKNGTEKTTLITPTIDDDQSSSNNKSNRYKYVTIAAAVSVFGLLTGTSSSSVGSSLLRQADVDADDDTDKVMAAVEVNIEEVGCKDKYYACKGFGQGNCCGGLECDGPGFGTCQYSGCNKIGTTCKGFQQGNCCDGGVCCLYGIIPGLGMCHKYDPYEGSCTGS